MQPGPAGMRLQTIHRRRGECVTRSAPGWRHRAVDLANKAVRSGARRFFFLSPQRRVALDIPNLGVKPPAAESAMPRDASHAVHQRIPDAARKGRNKIFAVAMRAAQLARLDVQRLVDPQCGQDSKIATSVQLSARQLWDGRRCRRSSARQERRALETRRSRESASGPREPRNPKLLADS